MTYNVFGGTLNLAQFNSNPGIQSGQPLCTVLPDRPLLSCVNRGRLRSAARGDLVVDTFYTDFGKRSFSVAAPKAWNELLGKPSDS